MRRHLLIHLVLTLVVAVALFFAARACNNRGFAKRQQGKLDEAIADYDMAISLNPNHAKAYNNRGVAYRKKGDLDRAIADYNEAIRLDPKDAKAYHNRGYAYWKKGDLDRAMATTTQPLASIRSSLKRIETEG